MWSDAMIVLDLDCQSNSKAAFCSMVKGEIWI